MQLLLLPTLSLYNRMATSDESSQASGGGGQSLGGGGGPAGLETLLGVNINPAGDHLLVGNTSVRYYQWYSPVDGGDGW